MPKSLLKRKPWEVRKLKEYGARTWLEQFEDNCVKVFDETNNYGLMVFSRWVQLGKERYPGYCVCPFEVEEGKTKWWARIFSSRATHRPIVKFDMLYVPKDMMPAFIQSLMRASGIKLEAPPAPGEKPAKKSLSKVDKQVRMFRLP